MDPGAEIHSCYTQLERGYLMACLSCNSGILGRIGYLVLSSLMFYALIMS